MVTRLHAAPQGSAFLRPPHRPTCLPAASAAAASPASVGRVHLVGAGPGAADLLTLKAVRLLGACDVVVYDDLADEEILTFARPGARLISVGKRGGRPSPPQAEIDALLVSEALGGCSVVRLKGGCPGLFGRVASEARALTAAGVWWEAVPGVTSAIAAPLLAGVPLTDKEVGRNVLIASAHSLDALPPPAVLAAVDTCVFLMAGAALPRLCQHLRREAGLPGATPAVVVQWAATERQRVWADTLQGVVGVVAADLRAEAPEVADAALFAGLSPAIVVVGAVGGKRLGQA